MFFPCLFHSSVCKHVLFEFTYQQTAQFFSCQLNWCQNAILVPQWLKFLFLCLSSADKSFVLSISTSLPSPSLCFLFYYFCLLSKTHLIKFIQYRSRGSSPSYVLHSFQTLSLLCLSFQFSLALLFHPLLLFSSVLHLFTLFVCPLWKSLSSWSDCSLLQLLLCLYNHYPACFCPSLLLFDIVH